MVNWYVIYVNVRHEKKVVQKLLADSIEAYSPVSKKLRQWSDRKKWIELPMITGYVFVKINILEKDKVLFNHAVLGFIKFNGKEAVVKDNEIEILKSIELTGYDVTQESNLISLKDKVKINQGHLKGLTGIVVQIQNEDYVQIELESLRQSIKVKVPKSILKIETKTVFYN